MKTTQDTAAASPSPASPSVPDVEGVAKRLDPWLIARGCICPKETTPGQIPLSVARIAHAIMDERAPLSALRVADASSGSGLPQVPAPAAERVPVAAIVPEHCTGSSIAFANGVLHVRKDGGGYIAVDEDDWTLEDDRCEGPDGPQGSVHWITRFPPGELEALRDFLNGANLFTAERAAEALAYAMRLATDLQRKHYPEVRGFQLLDDMLGVLTQIDNMTSVLTREASAQRAAARSTGLPEPERVEHADKPEGGE